MSEDEVTAAIENANTILGTDGGQMISLDKWGLRTLAYEIKKEVQGYYVYCDYATTPANVTELERKFRIDDSVMKYMTIKLADSINEEGILAARGEYEAAVIAAAEAAEEADKADDSSKKETVKVEEKAEKAKVEPTEASKES